ncbi:Broad specificity phosphatase PhoE [Halopseudomonas xinjiangensis]|uniref:Broad specificity phosphatase PhoE n=1 Tax=Halopseudomonas xinjiangensis TaxID=487184 RepID=A0A1H1PQW0_9GAMM|nr:histidine phosphatase family protein [Halopseudomonas xinjiangensis]SDS13711.1 Broad specificity phosphatase PhoE [Halopseudomonas xinjiangensis]
MRGWLELTCAILLLFASAQAASEPLAAVREGKAFVLLRHAHAPGVGDPADFKLGDCSTQRNLNEQGRRQSKAWGEKLRQVGLADIRLYSSRWCRALDTATAMELGAVTELPVLDSFFQDRDRAAQVTGALKGFLSETHGDQPVLLITHQVNITALTGLVPASGEALLIALPLGNPPEVLSRIPPP